MKNELRSSGHTVGETNLHLQFTPAYRRDIFSEPLARELTTAYIIQRSQEMKIEMAAIECGPFEEKKQKTLLSYAWLNHDATG